MDMFATGLAHCRGRWVALALVTASLAFAGAAAAQLVNYGEILGTYKDSRESGVKVIDSVSPGVAARARVARALANNSVVNQEALLQPDGTLKLPANQSSLVVRSTFADVQRGADGVVRIASPVIQGNVSGNVTLLVEGQGVRNITVINNPQ